MVVSQLCKCYFKKVAFLSASTGCLRWNLIYAVLDLTKLFFFFRQAKNLWNSLGTLEEVNRIVSLWILSLHHNVRNENYIKFKLKIIIM